VLERVDIEPSPVGGEWLIWWRGHLVTACSVDPERDAAKWLRRMGRRGLMLVFKDDVRIGVVDLDVVAGARVPGMTGGEPRRRATRWEARDLSIAAAST
jgi:hypothetical protein